MLGYTPLDLALLAFSGTPGWKISAEHHGAWSHEAISKFLGLILNFLELSGQTVQLQVECATPLGFSLYSLPHPYQLQTSSALCSFMWLGHTRRSLLAAIGILYPQVPLPYSAMHVVGHHTSLHFSWLSSQMAIGQRQIGVSARPCSTNCSNSICNLAQVASTGIQQFTQQLSAPAAMACLSPHACKHSAVRIA